MGHCRFTISLLLLAFGEFSGTGIKTSLGMGKYNIVDKIKITKK